MNQKPESYKPPSVSVPPSAPPINVHIHNQPQPTQPPQQGTIASTPTVDENDDEYTGPIAEVLPAQGFTSSGANHGRPKYSDKTLEQLRTDLETKTEKRDKMLVKRNNKEKSESEKAKIMSGKAYKDLTININHFTEEIDKRAARNR